MKPDPLFRPRTSRDAGPYLRELSSRAVGGWRLAVSGETEREAGSSWPASQGARDALEASGAGTAEGLEAAGTPPVLVSSCPRVLSAFQVGLTVLGRPGVGRQQGVRHIIAARDEATGELTGWPVGQLTRRGRRVDADQRDAGPYLETGRDRVRVRSTEHRGSSGQKVKRTH